MKIENIELLSTLRLSASRLSVQLKSKQNATGLDAAPKCELIHYNYTDCFGSFTLMIASG